MFVFIVEANTTLRTLCTHLQSAKCFDHWGHHQVESQQYTWKKNTVMEGSRSQLMR